MNFDVRIPLLEQNREKPSAQAVLELFKLQLQTGAPVAEPVSIADAFEVFDGEISVSDPLETDAYEDAPGADDLANQLQFGSVDEEDAASSGDASAALEFSRQAASGFDSEEISQTDVDALESGAPADDTAEIGLQLGIDAGDAVKPASDTDDAFAGLDIGTGNDDAFADDSFDSFAPTMEFKVQLAAEESRPGATTQGDTTTAQSDVSEFGKDELSAADDEEDNGIYVMGPQDGYGREGTAGVDLQHKARAAVSRPTMSYSADEFWQSVEDKAKRSQDDPAPTLPDAEATTMMRAYVPEEALPTESMENVPGYRTAPPPSADAVTEEIDASLPLVDPGRLTHVDAPTEEIPYGVRSATKGDDEDKKKKGFFSMFRKKK